METGVKEVELRDLWRRYKEEGELTVGAGSYGLKEAKGVVEVPLI